MMKRHLIRIARAGALSAAVCLIAAPAAAQTAPGKPAGKAAPKSAKVAAPAPLADASPDQVKAADLVFYGSYACEFDQNVEIAQSQKHPSYVDVKHGKGLWLMKPVLSSTGAIRLEDVKNETLMVQISSKSMLLNVKTGRRVVDECVSPKQRELIEAAKAEKAAEVARAAAALAAPSAPAATASTSTPTATAPATTEPTVAATPAGASAPR